MAQTKAVDKPGRGVRTPPRPSSSSIEHIVSFTTWTLWTGRTSEGSAVSCSRGDTPPFSETEKLHLKKSLAFPVLAGGLFWNLMCLLEYRF